MDKLSQNFIINKKYFKETGKGFLYILMETIMKENIEKDK